MTSTVEKGTAAAPTGRGRNVLLWAGLVVLLVAATFFAMRIAATSPAARGSLDPEGAGSTGSLAIAEILRDQGIEIAVVRDRHSAADALTPDSTLAMSDPFSLSDDAVQELTADAANVVFLSSSSRILRLFDLGESAAGATDGAVTAQCDLPEFAKLGTVAPDRFFTPAAGVTGCFDDGEGAAGVLIDDRTERRIALVESARLFGNDDLAEDGNAALALALLGHTERVVWYVPSYNDTDITGLQEDTIASLTPPWVTPAIVLALLASVAAIIWRGQRFGPLVSETLPVTVRVSETMHGRARLIAKAADSAYAADDLRIGSRRRLAARLGLHGRAGAEEIADAAADRVRVPRGSLYDLLAGPPPGTDAELVELARQLAELEKAVGTASSVERNRP